MKRLKLLLALILIIMCNPLNKYKGLKEGIYAEIITNKGNMFIELYSENVPMTVSNFVSLAEGTNSNLTDSLMGKDFYKDVIFHRVVPNLVIQAGGFISPKESKKLNYTFGDEFPKNSDSTLMYKHDDAGILSMANAGPRTNSSQFFITHRPTPYFDGKHSVFGKVIVNPTQLKELNSKFKDSLKLKKATDSVRMKVVNNIAKNDTIISINIIKVGVKAKKYNASKVFDEQFAKFKEREKIAAAEEIKRYSGYLKEKEKFSIKMKESRAKTTSSGLKILKLKRTRGKKVTSNKTTSVHFTLYLADGKKIQSTRDRKQTPFVFRLDDKQRPLIEGFKEGVLMMRVGEKARLFIPYYLGFGKNSTGPFPAKTDLIFDIEVLKIEK